jgi:copper transport protein
MASMSIRPARTGPVQIRIEPKAADLSPLRVEEVILYLTPDAKNAEAIRRQARRISGQQIWEVDGVTVPVPGMWRVKIDLLIDDFTRVSLDAVIAVQP